MEGVTRPEGAEVTQRDGGRSEEQQHQGRRPTAGRAGARGSVASPCRDCACGRGEPARVSMEAPPVGGSWAGEVSSILLHPQRDTERSGDPEHMDGGPNAGSREAGGRVASSGPSCAGVRGEPVRAGNEAPLAGGCWAGGVSSILLPPQAAARHGLRGQEEVSSAEATGGAQRPSTTAGTSSAGDTPVAIGAAGPTSTVASRGTRPCVVWAMGHSYIFWAEQRAGQREGGRWFGLPRGTVKVHWDGIRGMSWWQLRDRLARKLEQRGPPDVLLLHLGGNDVGKIPMKNIIERMKKDLKKVWDRAPKLILIWSQIVPRLVWREARELKALDKVRSKINTTMAKFVKRKGGISVRHKMIEGEQMYYRQDGVHLNEVGLDIFNFGLREGVEVAMKMWRGMRD
ncbi:hypothetical protein XENTR_v10021666 [Xenopus tropicalis]|nr:hypothetical protein XENTR_v10021666 [Xenopus tropicalis]